MYTTELRLRYFVIQDMLSVIPLDMSAGRSGGGKTLSFISSPPFAPNKLSRENRHFYNIIYAVCPGGEGADLKSVGP